MTDGLEVKRAMQEREAIARIINPITFTDQKFRLPALEVADRIIAEHIAPLRAMLVDAVGHANMESQKYTEACISISALEALLAECETALVPFAEPAGLHVNQQQGDWLEWPIDLGHLRSAASLLAKLKARTS